MNYWLPLFACLIGGMTLKWLLDLFFLRSHLERLERQLSARDAEYTALKHDHSRALTDLKNKLTELDATTKAKALAEGTLAKRDSDITAFRSHLTFTEAELAAGRTRESNLIERLAARELELHTATRSLEFRNTENCEVTAALGDLRLRLAEATAGLATQAGALRELHTNFDTISQNARTAAANVSQLEGEIASHQSVATTLSAAIRSRDAQIADLQHRLAALEIERQSIATSLSVADRDLGSTRIQTAELTTRLEAADQAGVAHQQEATRLRTELAAIAQARTAAEASLKRREIEAAEWERKASRNHPIPPAAADPPLAQRIHDLEAEIEAVSISHAKLEADFTAERRRADELEAKLHVEIRRDAAWPVPVETSTSEAQLFVELDELNRERNALAAELAALKAAQPPLPAGASGRKKSKPAANAAVDLFAAPRPSSVPLPIEPTPADGPAAEEN